MNGQAQKTVQSSLPAAPISNKFSEEACFPGMNRARKHEDHQPKINQKKREVKRMSL
jgi:hypothetical protein